MKPMPISRAARRGACSSKLLVLAAALLVLVAAAWVLLLPRIVTSTIRRQTGFEVKVEHLRVNPFTADMVIRGLVVRNPEGWPIREFVDLREFRAEVNLFSLIGDRVEADEVVLDIARVTLVRNPEGMLNAVKFKEGFGGDGAKPADPAPKPGEPGPAPKFLIKHMVVRLDHITYADHSRARPSVREYPLNINRELRDVDSVAELLNPLYTANVAVVSEALGGMFQDSVEILKGTGETLKDAGQKATETVKGFLDKLKPKN